MVKLFSSVWSKYTDNSLTLAQLVDEVLAVESHWDMDLTTIEGLSNEVTTQLAAMLEQGVNAVLTNALEEA